MKKLCKKCHHQRSPKPIFMSRSSRASCALPSCDSTTFATSTLAAQTNDSAERKESFHCIRSKPPCSSCLSPNNVCPLTRTAVDHLRIAHRSIRRTLSLGTFFARKQSCCFEGSTLRRMKEVTNALGFRSRMNVSLFSVRLISNPNPFVLAPIPRSKKNRQVNTEFEEDVEVIREKRQRTSTAMDAPSQ